MIALFHSPVAGQSGCTSAVASIACVASSKFKQNTLVIQLRDNTIPIEKLLFKKELESSSVKSAEYEFTDTGIDALLRRAEALTTGLQKEHFENCCIDTLSGNEKLSIISVTNKISIEAELNSCISTIIELLKKAESFYDLVMVVMPNTNSEFTKNLLNVQELNYLSVLCVPQSLICIGENNIHKISLRDIFGKKDDEQHTDRTLLLVGNFDIESKYSPKNIAKAYGINQKKICSILHDAHYKDSISQGDLFNFIMKNMEDEMDDDIFSFARYLTEATGKMLAQEPKDGKIIYTDELPDKKAFQGKESVPTKPTLSEIALEEMSDIEEDDDFDIEDVDDYKENEE